jgi:GNAT superfamily N-acetyltransferase
MSSTRIETDLILRPFVPADESEVLALLVSALGEGPSGRRTPEFFQWKHLDNPFGKSFLLVAELDSRVVGLRAFLRWRFVAGERTVRAVRAVDTVTHPDHQGKGIFSKLTLRALEMLRADTDLVFNTPNASSLPGYLKMGWKVVGQIPISVRVRRPLAFAAGLRSVSSKVPRTKRQIDVDAPFAADVLTDLQGLGAFVDLVGNPSDHRLRTPLSVEYLLWRYARAPLGYRVIIERDGAQIRGMAIFRIRPRGVLWEATIAEVLVPPGDVDMASALLDEVCAAGRIDHATCHFPTGSTQLAASKRRHFLKSPKGELLTVNPFHHDLEFASSLDSWSASLGTLEVF